MRYGFTEINNITHFKTGLDFIGCGKTKEKSDHKIICPDCLKRLQQYLNKFEHIEDQLHTLDYSFRHLFRSSYDKDGHSKSKVDNKCYKFIPLESSVLINNFHNLKSDNFKAFYKETMNKDFNPLSFLDAGCGHGNVMLIAGTTIMERIMGTDEFPTVQGIDFDPANVKKAKVMLGIDNPYHKRIYKVMKGDIRTFKHYNKYDIIYFYVPLIDKEELNKFLDNLYTTAKVGAVIITHGARQCSPKLWEKIRKDFVPYTIGVDGYNTPAIIKTK